MSNNRADQDILSELKKLNETVSEMSQVLKAISMRSIASRADSKKPKVVNIEGDLTGSKWTIKEKS